ncbi:MAG: ABC transporter ATP-binding protein [Pseudomonadota bacterium]
MSAPIVEVTDICKTFPLSRGRKAQLLHAVNNVSFAIAAKETLGLVGESGSGKSTVGRMLVGVYPASSGRIRLFGRDISGDDAKANLKAVRRRLQFVFQDPQAALNPRMQVGDAIAEPLDIAGGLDRHRRQARIGELIDMVGLPRSAARRYPHEFSGGQRQRIVIARALALQPDFIVCDEAVSALDVSMQAQVVNLLMDLQAQFGLSYLFIAHDLAVVRSVSTRVAVMYAGSIVEIAPKRALYETPRHPYTRALLDAVPRVHGAARPRQMLQGEPPSLIDPPAGCRFASRCPVAETRCRVESPPVRTVAPGHQAACHLV